ncbi:MAG TPA: amidohydrolase family protein [Pseudolabrys sp.]|nr:amidohydrolase family protein [Pseudolabrys sp.]
MAFVLPKQTVLGILTPERIRSFKAGRINAMHIFDEPKIDCHAHVLDPANFPYGRDIAYKPAGQEIGTTAQLTQVMKTYGVKHALLVQPNSGYGSDNSCMLDAIAKGKGRFKGIAIIDLQANVATLKEFQTQGIVGAAINPTFHGNEYYEQADSLMKRLADLDMFFNLQVENDQLLMFAPWIERIPVKVLIDHVGRPTPPAGFHQPAFQAMLRLAKTGRVNVKISGYLKFTKGSYPFQDCWPFVRTLVDAFTLDHCMWASDWPYLRAPERQDYGPLVELAGQLFPNSSDRRKLFWDTPNRLFKFAQ